MAASYYPHSLLARADRVFNEKAAKVAVGIIFIVFLVQSMKKGVFRYYGNDFTIYLEGAAVFFGGANPYGLNLGSTDGLVYPLFSCFVVQPFNYLPVWAAHLVWYVGNFVLLFAVLRAVQVRVGGSFKWVPFAIMLIPMLDALQSNMRNGQINIIALAGALGFMVFMKEKRENLAAVCLAVSVSVKMLPLLLFGYLLINRRFAIVLKGIAAIAVLNFGLPYLVAGGDLPDYYAVFYEGIKSKSAGLPFASDYLPAQFFARSFYNFWLAGSIIAMAGIHLHVNKRTRMKNERVFYLYFLFMLFAVPNVLQAHHMVWLFPPILAIVHDLYAGKNSTVYKRGHMIIALAAFFVLNNMGRFMALKAPFYLVSIALLFGMTVFWALDERKE